MLPRRSKNASLTRLAGDFKKGSTGLSCFYSYDLGDEQLTDYSTLFGENPWIYLYRYAQTGQLSEQGLAYLRQQAAAFPAAATVTPKVYTLHSAKDFLGYPVAEEENGEISLNLGPELGNEVAEVYLSVEIVDPSRGVEVLGQCNDLQADWQNGVFKSSFRGVWPALDGEFAHMVVDDETDDYVVYNTPIKLGGKPHTLVVAYTYATGEYALLGARPGQTDAGMAAKRMVPLKTGDTVTLMRYTQLTQQDVDDFAAETRKYLLATVPALAQATPEELEAEVAKILTETNTSVGVFGFVNGAEITITPNTRFAEKPLAGSYALLFEMIDVLSAPARSESKFIVRL